MTKFASISAAAPSPEPPAADVPAPALDGARRLAAAVARAERRLRMLEEIGEIGMRLMRKLEDTPAADAPPTDPAANFAKLSRAVRLTLDLEVRAEEDLRAALAGEVSAHAGRREARERRAIELDEKRYQDAQNRVADQVGIAIAREVETEKEFDERHAARDERLEWDAAYDELLDRPLREVVEQLCGDLGLTPDWSDWTDDGWPEPKEIGPDARPQFSPFKRPSPRPILKRTLQKPRHSNPFELAKPPP